MTKINDLLQSINIFHREAMLALQKQAAPTTWSMPDDDEEEEQELPDDPNTGKYNKMVDLARKVRNPDLSSEILLVAELYKKAIEMGAGFSTVNTGVNNLINELLSEQDDPDQEDPEMEMVEDTLNEVVKDLRTRAGGPGALNKEDPPAVKMQLRALKDAFNRKAIEEETNPEQDDAGGGTLSDEEREGLSEQTEGDLTQFEENAKSTFDLSGGVGLEARQQGAGSGVSFTRKKDPKDWIKTYQNERERFQDLLGKEKSKLIFDKIKRLTEVLAKLESNTAAEINLSNALMETKGPQDIDEQGNKIRSKRTSTFGAPDPKKEAELAALRKEDEELKKERAALKNSVRNTEIQKNTKVLETTLAQATDPAEKFLLDQQIKLQNLLMSNDVNRGPEADARRRLIRAISKKKVETLDHRELYAFQLPSKETLAKLQQEIEEASKLKRSKREYNVDVAKKIQNEKVTGTFAGKVTRFQQEINTQKNAIRDKLEKQVKKNADVKYQSFIDRINVAKQNKDAVAEKAVIVELRAALEAESAIVEYATLSKEFKDIRENLLSPLVKSGIVDSNEPLGDAFKQSIITVIDACEKVYLNFSGRGQYYDQVADQLNPVIQKLKMRIGYTEASFREGTFMKKNVRKQILKRLEKEAYTGVPNTEGLVNQVLNPPVQSTTGDYGHQVFDALVDDIFNKIDSNS